MPSSSCALVSRREAACLRYVCLYLALGISGQSPISEKHIVLKLLVFAQFLDPRDFLSEHSIRAIGAVEIRLREIAVVPVGVLGLDDGDANPGRATLLG